MKIAIITPLYPPDVAPLAQYVKELATRLSSGNKITVLTYGYIPEAISGVTIVPVDKREPLPVRLFRLFREIKKAANKNDVLYVENGASSELPVFLVTFFSRTPTIFHIGDTEAHERTKKRILLSIIEHLTKKRADAIITSLPSPRPEILPFNTPSGADWAAHENTWNEHLRELTNTLQHVKK